MTTPSILRFRYLWDRSQVAEWLHGHGRIAREEVVRARIVREANLHFDLHEA